MYDSFLSLKSSSCSYICIELFESTILWILDTGSSQFSNNIIVSIHITGKKNNAFSINIFILSFLHVTFAFFTAIFPKMIVGTTMKINAKKK